MTPHLIRPALIPVPPGRVTLSDRRTQHTWQVDLAPYSLAAHPVTQALYAEVTGLRPSTAPGDLLPVHDVSWLDATRFCNILSERDGLTPAYQHDVSGQTVDWDTAADGYRLPTEAEWEHACRAGTSGPRYGPLDDIAWYRDNSGERPRDVGTRQPNSWGLYDMLGNAWDWCWDLYDPDVYGEYRVLRGGGWYDPHWSCRASTRRRTHPTHYSDDITLRIARNRV